MRIYFLVIVASVSTFELANTEKKSKMKKQFRHSESMCL